MASDSHATIFNEKLKPLLSATQRINIYFHRKDKALKTSTRIQKKDRLGLYGTKIKQEGIYSEIKFIDVTRTKAKGSRGFTRHVYFKKDRKVRADIKRIFLDQETERTLKLIKAIDNLYKLN